MNTRNCALFRLSVILHADRIETDDPRGIPPLPAPETGINAAHVWSTRIRVQQRRILARTWGQA